MKKLLVATAALAMAVGTAQAGPESGLKEGSRVGAYYVMDVTGPSQGEKLCYRCKYGSDAVVNVFTRTTDDKEFVELVKQLDAKVGKDKKMKAFVTVLTNDQEGAKKALKELAKKENIKNVPLTVYETPAGPDSYKIAKDAEITVLMWNNSTVKVNKSFGKDEMCEMCVKDVVASTDKLMK